MKKVLIFMLCLLCVTPVFADYHFGPSPTKYYDSNYEYIHTKNDYNFGADTDTGGLIQPDKPERKDKNVAYAPPEKLSGVQYTNLINSLYTPQSSRFIELPSSFVPSEADLEKVTKRDYLLPSDVNKPEKPTPTVKLKPISDKPGVVGRFIVPSLSFDYPVYDNASYQTMLKGVGLVYDTATFYGNVCLAGHNRGVKNSIGDIRKAKIGDTIFYTYKDATKEYAITNFAIVDVTDISVLAPSTENKLTIITCLNNRPSVRLIVTALEKESR